VAASAITSGQTFQLNYIVDFTYSSITANVTILPVLCSATPCTSGNSVPLAAQSTTVGVCAATFTCSYVVAIECIGTGTPGTVLCAPISRIAGAPQNTQTAVVSGVPTSGNVYIGLSYNGASQAGNSASLMAAWGSWGM
jgi:hypothetical protein